MQKLLTSLTIIFLMVLSLTLTACSNNSSGSYIFNISYPEGISAGKAIVRYDESALKFIDVKGAKKDVIAVGRKSNLGEITVAFIAYDGVASGPLVSLNFAATSKGAEAPLIDIIDIEVVEATARPNNLSTQATFLTYTPADISASLANNELGDVNKDGIFNLSDLGGLNEVTVPTLVGDQQILADFNGDGIFGTIDSLLALTEFLADLGAGDPSDALLVVQPNEPVSITLGQSVTVLALNGGSENMAQPTIMELTSLGPAAIMIDPNNQLAGESYAFTVTPESTGTKVFTLNVDLAGSKTIIVNVQ